MFYSEKSFHSEYIHSKTYLVTSNKGNAKFYYSLCLYFLKINTEDPDLIPPFCCYIQSHLQTLRACPLENIH